MLALAFPLLLLAADPVLEGPVECDYGVDRPVLPGPKADREALYDLLLGQRLRKADRAAISAVLRRRFPGEATDAFLLIHETVPLGEERDVAIFEGIVRRHGASSDPDLQVEVARARVKLIDSWNDRHIRGMEHREAYIWTAATWRETEAGRRWSALIDSFLKDYRGRGERFDEFVAQVEMTAIFRDVNDRTPDDDTHDQRLLDPEDAPARAWLRARMAEIIARYGNSRRERVQRTVARARDMLAPYELGRESLIPIDRDLIARYRGARDYELRANVGGAFNRLKLSLDEVGRKNELAAVVREEAAWEAETPDADCSAPRGSSGP